MRDDLISRQAAIDRATKEHDFFRGAVTVSDKARRDELLNVMCWLGELPPVQPEVTEEEVKEYCRKRCLCIVDSALLKEYTSVQPEQKKGKWIEYEQSFMLGERWETVQKTVRECSVCTAKIAGFVGIMNFCPNCGTDMREEA